MVDKQHSLHMLKRLKKKFKKVSPLFSRTVKGAKKGIYTTIKICKKTSKTDMIEPLVYAQLFFIRLFGSIALKTGKNAVRKGRMPKFSFIAKHFTRAAGYLTIYPLLLLIVLHLSEIFMPGCNRYIKYGLVSLWIV
jgi:hypothetical protein